ncbi:LEAF RUST 10 DISEASE-RESISTANCE LOCUS RECEPTOR-LIKE PROTEIN KINASE-like 2.5 [Cardamine amara subsp. amara]|uniref:non-specific serine/threonine protein kinase n=1 Tax=Cardamine amara subsp. amara TaxID=228776 RepID=A0ABD1BBB4_CARAN
MVNLSLHPKKTICFIWMLFVIPSCVFSSNELHKHCNGTFTCGDQRDLYYPFWNPDREGCGHPDFRLECGQFAEFSVSSVKFRVLEMNSSIIKLGRSDFINELCPNYPPNVLFNQSVLPLAPNTEMLTLYFDCKLDFTPSLLSPFGAKLECPDDVTDGITNYYVTRNLSSTQLQRIRGLLDDLKECDRNVSIPASGSALTSLQQSLSEDNLKKALTDGFDLGLNQECLSCLNSRGACGYDLTSDTFACYKIKNGFSTVAKAGIGAACGFLVVILIIVGLLYLIRRRKKTQEDQYTSKDLQTTSLFQQNLKPFISQPKLEALIPLKQYSYTQVKRITKSFAEVVGRGGFGTVYRGTLCDGRMVAVKVLKESKGNNGEDFINEVASMSQTSHVNIVTLLGFCSEGSQRAIIYEFLENGSLDKFLSSKISANLDWTALYRIALGVSRALEYLHHGCRTRIVHFDIKPQNVLLDDNICPKVSDFGLAKLCERKESILSLLDTRGTIGYIAPEVFSSVYGRVSHKSDVYSYGMLILEMVGARNKPAIEDTASSTSSMYFPEWIYKDLDKGDNGRLIENGISCAKDEITKKMTLVGLWCIQPWPSDRPSMNRVVEMLEGSVDALEVPPRPVLQCSVVPHLESSWISEESSIPSDI